MSLVGGRGSNHGDRRDTRDVVEGEDEVLGSEEGRGEDLLDELAERDGGLSGKRRCRSRGRGEASGRVDGRQTASVDADRVNGAVQPGAEVLLADDALRVADVAETESESSKPLLLG